MDLKKILLMALGLLPFLWLVAMHCCYWSSRTVSFILYSRFYCACLLVFLIVAIPWAVHLIRGKPVVSWLLCLLISTAVWTCLRADRCLEISYFYKDEAGEGEEIVRQFLPIGPVWRMPPMGDVASGDPTIAWDVMLTKAVLGITAGYVLLHFMRCIYRWAMKVLRRIISAWISERRAQQELAEDENSWP